MPGVNLTQDDLKSALPDVSGDKAVKGLESDIHIYRDSQGIPHVKANSAHDAFFGQAFATAQDRLWHMDYDRRAAYGRWAEFAGPSAVDSDKAIRRFQIGPTVRLDYEAINVDSRAMLDAYAAGVNAFIDNTDSLPVEYGLVGGKPERWEPWDCLAVFKVRHIMMGVFEGKLWRTKLVNTFGPEKAARLLKGCQPGQLIIVPPGETYSGEYLDGLQELAANLDHLSWLQDDPDAGSNNWVLTGARTASGKPLLAGDPHRGLDVPNCYYQNHIACPDFDVIGLSFPGCPGFPHFGHSADVAWCVTHAQADYQDLYLERFDSDAPSQYRYKDGWKKAEVRREVINVRGSDPVEIDVSVTHHGPIIAGEPSTGHGVAFRYTSTAEVNLGSQCLLDMLKAKTTDQMDEATREWVDPCNNFVFADVDGNVEYLNRGKLPLRSMANAWLPVPGWTGEHEWNGYVPFEELVRSKNPDTGYIVTANNQIADAEYPHYIALSYASEYRARRILERLKSLREATADDMAAIHAERISIPARILIGPVADVESSDPLVSKAKDLLMAWNGSMEVDDVAPTVFAAYRGRLLERVIRQQVGPLTEDMLSASGRGAPNHLQQLATQLNSAVDSDDISMLPEGLPEGEDWSSLAHQALTDGVADLRRDLGEDMDNWIWGKVHATRPVHPLSTIFPDISEALNPPSVSMGGGLDTPQAAGHSPMGPYVIAGTSVARYVFDLADWENSRWIVPLGSSGHPGSPHYADQAITWANVELIYMRYGWEGIRKDAVTSQVLSRKG